MTDKIGPYPLLFSSLTELQIATGVQSDFLGKQPVTFDFSVVNWVYRVT